MFKHLAVAMNLTPLALKLFNHLEKAGSISAREAMGDYGITSASLTRRITEMVDAGIEITRKQARHPIHDRPYTRYSLTPTTPTPAADK